MARAHQDPFALLRSIEQASIATSPRLPQDEQASILWSGVGFKLADLQLVTALDQVVEILPCPVMTPVPGTKPWVKGVANIRGNLVTIVDLAEYFERPPVFLGDAARLMVLNLPGANTGVLVSEVLGLRHFDEEVERRELPTLEDPAVAHMSGAFMRDDSFWGVFDMTSLAESQNFRHVAI